MRAGLAFAKAANIPNLPNVVIIGRTRRGIVDRMREVWAICSRANAASHTYEELKPLSDAELAARGLDRADLPRAAFRQLTGKR